MDLIEVEGGIMSGHSLELALELKRRWCGGGLCDFVPLQYPFLVGCGRSTGSNIDAAGEPDDGGVEDRE